MENQGDLRLLSKAGMTAREHHPQQVIFDGVRRKDFLDDRDERPLAFKEPAKLGGERARRAPAPQDIKSAIFRRGHKPSGGILRHAAEFPHLHRAAEGILHHVFRQREVVDSENPRQGGHHPPRFTAKEKVARFHLMQPRKDLNFALLRHARAENPATSRGGIPVFADIHVFLAARSRTRRRCSPGSSPGDKPSDEPLKLSHPQAPYMLSFRTGRTSTEPPTSSIGQAFESSTACAMSLASTSI